MKHIPKTELIDGAYYKGDCRNASVARWNAKLNLFFYNRRKFGDTFVEDIRCPEDDDGMDLFYAEERIEPTTAQFIPLTQEEMK